MEPNIATQGGYIATQGGYIETKYSHSGGLY